jgi:hypothetical protein
MRQIHNRIKTFRFTNDLCDLLSDVAAEVGASEGKFVRTAVFELCREVRTNPEAKQELRERSVI